MIRAAALVAALALAGCDQPAPEPAASQPPQAEPALPARVSDIELPQYRPASDGGPEAYMMARLGGRLALRGRCLGLTDAEGGNFQTIVWTAGARLSVDERGPFIADGDDRLRPGDMVMGGGGEMPDGFPDSILAKPFPAECERDNAVQLWGIERMPADIGPPEPEPPPPSAFGLPDAG